MKKILVADDEFLIRYSLSHILSTELVEVITVTTGREALQEISARDFDLCCLDIRLPDMNGMDIMKTVKKLAPKTKIIIMTGNEITEEMRKDIQENAELLLSKPFDLFKMKTFVDRILELEKPSCGGETNQVRHFEPFEYWLMNDQRRHERQRAVNRTAVATTQHEQEQSAEIIDISEGGMCVFTTCQMPDGTVLKICNDKSEQCNGVVRWSTMAESGDAYRTGIQFIPGKEPNS